MAKHLRRDLDALKKEILTMGAMVEEAANKAISALMDRRPELADEVIEGDDAIDDKEVHIEVECMKILALHQPVASDLRFTVTVLKVNNDLERMGDLAVNIAERVRGLAGSRPAGVPVDFREMIETVRRMVRWSLDALVNLDTALARKVCQEDDHVDRIHGQMFGILQEIMKRDTETIEWAIHTLSVSRNLERIADLSTNIAEDVVFLAEAEVVRHRRI